MRGMKLEPVAVVNSIVTLAEALVAPAVGFGLTWSGEQVGLVMAVVVGLGTVVQTLWARGQVTPVTDPRNAAGSRLTSEN